MDFSTHGIIDPIVHKSVTLSLSFLALTSTINIMILKICPYYRLTNFCNHKVPLPHLNDRLNLKFNTKSITPKVSISEPFAANLYVTSLLTWFLLTFVTGITDVRACIY